MLYKLFFLIAIVLLIGQCQGHRGRSREKPRIIQHNEVDLCPKLRRPKYAQMRCKRSRYSKICVARCIAHHIFEGTELNKYYLGCYDGYWLPEKSFPKCVPDGKCQLKFYSAGEKKCKNTYLAFQCQIRCDGRDFGVFTCQPDGSWDFDLPYCVINPKPEVIVEPWGKETSSRGHYGQGRSRQRSRSRGLYGQGSRGQRSRSRELHGQGRNSQ